ncbi:class I SAM-dependent methyltransferase [Staphylococcus pasteuri]|uniref:class I SAM-dependent methyltransferase n=1 Tax=Staphylococcus pasteuri TaxID=45972 RepID=UPI000F822538|nr:class I SAM-dependent methyltransferase [Staphylococcus pasteuri]MEB6612109.1 class I SAM-dependent methyltransferase [Staphylococcus pasteuri]QQN53640.1 class I SAM-dependent methyltransferase [Staphylococcus pasteuri]RTX74143.1 class I SAM-dependent methyltransferase [Staphylococcus pasteuri]
MTTKILDACCGSKMFWFDKENKDVTFMDIRELDTELSDGRKLVVKPDIMADFRNMPFEDNSFHLVVFDPPHLKTGGDKSWLVQKYGRLNENWPDDIKQGFNECMRVLKPNGTLIFKWNEEQIKLGQILKCFNQAPLFGNKRAKTHWLVFMKLEEAE